MARRSRVELDSGTQCPRCAGSGVAEHPLRYGPTTCLDCAGSGLVRPPKFRAECECGTRQPGWTTAFTSEQWMSNHLRSHAPEEPDQEVING